MGPIGFIFDVLVFQPRSNAHALPIPIAMRMGGKSEENILSNPWRQVDQFGPSQLDLSRKILHSNRKNKSIEAAYALEFDIHGEASRYEQARSGHSDVE